ncbi:hypothetical protein FV222_09665 [Methylobacterium sp. WL103]|uniref:hypothetical protein n=1 Tax=Methylobacterium sp. WL103 TaxID=2603891 RepID=UPI0011CAAA1B|nr:hypothetical protein [Methylobacterium sp. WL103]TXN02311.1 hypothetical protein FV222_09665 [Methylobacterium sp. WL103]
MANVTEVIDQLVQRRAELRAELTKLEEAIDTLSALANTFSDISGNSSKSKKAKETPVERQRERGILPPEEIARFARNTLLKIGRPVKRGALVAAMERDGVPMAGKDKAKNLGTIIWRHQDDFVSLENLGYWPRDIAIKGVYDPRKPPDGIRSPRLKKSS